MHLFSHFSVFINNIDTDENQDFFSDKNLVSSEDTIFMIFHNVERLS